MGLKTSLVSTLILAVFPLVLHAQAVEVEDQGAEVQQGTQAPPASGKAKAGQYFQKRASTSDRSPSASGGATPRYLAIHIGRMFGDQSYKWGDNDQKNIGGLNAGLTYRLGEWVNSMDFNLRVEYTNYALAEGNARKLGFNGLLTFPDANSRFPLYFGAGAGLGLFMKQLENESPLSFDYQLVGGVRFLDVFPGVGFMVEAGIKNHILLTSYGQYNGVFVNIGSVFAF